MNIHNENCIQIRFYEELNYFIKKYPHKTPISFSFNGKRSVKDLIEGFGVPHTEVDLILVNQESVHFDYIVRNRDKISVYPMFEHFNIQGISLLRETPLRDSCFILDVHLGKLARLLRMLGFDTDYVNSRDDPELAAISHNENRILLSCGRGLLMRKIVSRGILIRSNKALEQCAEVLNKLNLWDRISPFSRCINCNGLLKSITLDHEDYSEILTSVPAGVSSWCRDYARCTHCSRIYWKGSHYDKMNRMIDELKKLQDL